MAVCKCYFVDRFGAVFKEYAVTEGGGKNHAEQLVTAMLELILAWYEFGDVYDNMSGNLSGWVDDLSNQANWLYQHADVYAQSILDKIYGCKKSGDYEDLLAELAEYILDPQKLKDRAQEPPDGNIHFCVGKFEFEMF